MEAITNFIGLLDHLIGAIEFLAVGTICTLVAISVLPRDNPLRQTLQGLCQRLMMTLGASVIAVPVELIPGADVLYDIGAPVVLGYVWFTFIRDVLRSSAPPVPSSPAHSPSHIDALRSFVSHALHSGKPSASSLRQQGNRFEAPPRVHDAD